jgi:hypothetical protein
MGGNFLKATAPLFFMTTYRMSLVSAEYISLDSTFRWSIGNRIRRTRRVCGGNFCPKPEAVGEGESILEGGGGGGVLLHIPAEPLRIMTPEMKKRQAGSRELIIAACPTQDFFLD